MATSASAEWLGPAPQSTSTGPGATTRLLARLHVTCWPAHQREQQKMLQHAQRHRPRAVVARTLLESRPGQPPPNHRPQCSPHGAGWLHLRPRDQLLPRISSNTHLPPGARTPAPTSQTAEPPKRRENKASGKNIAVKRPAHQFFLKGDEDWETLPRFALTL